MSDEIKRTFRESLEKQVARSLGLAGIHNIAVKAYERDGHLALELSGSERELRDARKAVSAFNGIITEVIR